MKHYMKTFILLSNIRHVKENTQKEFLIMFTVKCLKLASVNLVSKLQSPKIKIKHLTTI